MNSLRLLTFGQLSIKSPQIVRNKFSSKSNLANFSPFSSSNSHFSFLPVHFSPLKFSSSETKNYSTHQRRRPASYFERKRNKDPLIESLPSTVTIREQRHLNHIKNDYSNLTIPQLFEYMPKTKEKFIELCYENPTPIEEFIRKGAGNHAVHAKFIEMCLIDHVVEMCKSLKPSLVIKRIITYFDYPNALVDQLVDPKVFMELARDNVGAFVLFFFIKRVAHHDNLVPDFTLKLWDLVKKNEEELMQTENGKKVIDAFKNRFTQRKIEDLKAKLAMMKKNIVFSEDMPEPFNVFEKPKPKKV